MILTKSKVINQLAILLFERKRAIDTIKVRMKIPILNITPISYIKCFMIIKLSKNFFLFISKAKPNFRTHTPNL